MGIDYSSYLYIGWTLDTKKIIEHILDGTQYKTYKEMSKDDKNYYPLTIIDHLLMKTEIPKGWEIGQCSPEFDCEYEQDLFYLYLKDVPTDNKLARTYSDYLSLDYIFNQLKQDLDNSDLQGARDLASKLGGVGEPMILSAYNID